MASLLACDSGSGRRVGARDGGTGSMDGSTGADGSTGTSEAGTAPPPSTCTPTGGEGTLESCTDGMDNDCDGLPDCSDTDCSGVGSCPVCGQVDTQLGSPISLPDGEGGTDCTVDTDCPTGQSCFDIDSPTDRECRESYRSTLDLQGFGTGTFESADDIVSICVNMEHSFVRDLEIALEAPNGSRVRLQRFLGQTGGEIYLGEADDCDDDDTPVPGVGARYCWTPTATRPAMLEYANSGGALNSVPACDLLGFGLGGDAEQMPPGDYSSAEDWNNFIGSPLNGEWSLVVTDLYPIDNGYIFDWQINFSPRAIEDCSVPLI
ncbi:MAG: hypothetical protein AAF938_21070 [Myxococcota bacterium]